MTPLSGTFQPCGGLVVVWQRWRVLQRNKPMETYVRKRSIGETENEQVREMTPGSEGIDREEGNKGAGREEGGGQQRENERSEEYSVMCSGPVCLSVWLHKSWCYLKIEWFGIKAINISLSFDEDPRGV